MKSVKIILIIIQLFIAIGAIPAGLLYIIDSSGGLMGQTPDLLTRSPFGSFLVPGLFLFVINGFGNLVASILTWRNHPKSRLLSMSLGAILCLWIIIQVYWISLGSFLQPLLFIIGLCEFGLAYWLWKKSKQHG